MPFSAVLLTASQLNGEELCKIYHRKNILILYKMGVLQWSKPIAFADFILSVAENVRFVFEKIQNVMEK